MNKRSWHIPPEENERRMRLWRQGLTDSQMAKILKLNPGTIASWRKARRLASNSEGDRELEWGLHAGDWLEVGLPKYIGNGYKKTKWHKGLVLEVYPRFAVVQLEKYRVTISRWELRCGEVQVKKLERKAG